MRRYSIRGPSGMLQSKLQSRFLVLRPGDGRYSTRHCVWFSSGGTETLVNRGAPKPEPAQSAGLLFIGNIYAVPRHGRDEGAAGRRFRNSSLGMYMTYAIQPAFPTCSAPLSPHSRPIYSSPSSLPSPLALTLRTNRPFPSGVPITTGARKAAIRPFSRRRHLLGHWPARVYVAGAWELVPSPTDASCAHPRASSSCRVGAYARSFCPSSGRPSRVERLIDTRRRPAHGRLLLPTGSSQIRFATSPLTSVVSPLVLCCVPSPRCLCSPLALRLRAWRYVRVAPAFLPG
ncbi:hypothetical protein C8J57DRAFT_1307665 [Mycena rebaudengoi]|nr:hypothetical protein C8J57DRAFT_1307665 [Mycena rebaudengoi]